MPTSPPRPVHLGTTARLGRLFEPLVTAPETAGVFLDFDGTVSEIVDDPSAAAPVAGAVEALVALSEVVGKVGVISGRPVAFLEPMFPPELDLSGLYGLERRSGGERTDHPQAGAWREVVADITTNSAGRGPAGMRVESKGVSLTLHYREHPELADDVRAWAHQQAARSGLVAREARMSVELHPPIPADKGSAIAEMADGLDFVVYVGDDIGDLPAFAALDAMAERGIGAVKVAVSNAESGDLAAHADAIAEGPAAMAAWLRAVVRRLTA